MKKKFWLILLALASALCLAFAVAACGGGHKHTYEKAWTYDKTYHWHKASCGHNAVSEKATHTFGDDDICDVCKYQRPESGSTPEAHSHPLTKHEAKDPTCTEDGNLEYWECEVCDKVFSDSEGKTETTLDKVTLKASHTLTKHDAKEATETEDGNKLYFECEVCEKFFSDEKGEHEIEDHSSVFIPSINHEHVPERHAEKEPTCTEDGNILYYECGKCHKLFLDELCTEETSAATVTRTAKGHTPKAEWEQGDTTHYHLCVACGEKIPESESAHDFSAGWMTNPILHWKECSICNFHADEAEHDYGSDDICDRCDYQMKAPSVGLDYKLNDDNQSYSVTGIGTCQDTDIVIPAMHDGYPVTQIGNHAFSDCRSLTSIIIPNSVTSIGEATFSGCISLEHITVEKGNTAYRSETDCLIEISTETVISGCKNSVIPDSVTSIGDWAFYDCSLLTSIVIPDGVTSIGHATFRSCASLTNITIPKNVTSIGEWAFEGCINLTSITIPEGVTSIGEWTFADCRSLESITIPEGVTSIGKGAFAYCNGLTSITIPDSVTLIEEGAFSLTNITMATMPTLAIDYIPKARLRTVVLTSGVFIAGEAFSNCTSLRSITIPDSVTSIGDRAFYGCANLTSITIPESVTSIGSGVFAGCGLEHITVEKGNITYRSEADCLIEISTKTVISGCKNSVIPDGVTSIGYRAFYSCDGLTSITIPDSVTSIGDSAFSWCNGLTSIEIPDSVTSIGNYGFYKCGALKKVYYGGTKANWGKIDIGSNNNNLTSATRYYFSEKEPTAEEWAEWGYWWHFDETTGEVVEWVKPQA